MSYAGKATGEWGENAAADYLRDKGLQVLDRNVRNDLGELDIVAKDGDTLVFVEVKAFEIAPEGTDPGVNVHRRKQQRIGRCAAAYISYIRPIPYCRFDVVTVVREPQFKLEHHIGAFTL